MHLIKHILILSLSLCAASSQGAQAGGRNQQLYVYNWSDYIDENLIVDFEARYKTSVNYQTYESINALKETLKQLAYAPEAKKRELDVIILPGFLLKGLVEQNLLTPIRRRLLSNDKDIYPILIKHLQQVSSEVGRTNIFAMPYLWGTSGLAYNARLLNKRQDNFPRQNWSLLFDPSQASKFSDCGIVMADRPREVFQILKNYLGLAPQSTAQEDFTKAEIALRKIRPYVEVMNGIDAANALAYGDACIVMAQSQEIFLAQQDAQTIAEEQQGSQRQRRKNLPQLTYKLPAPAGLLWMDIIIIPAQSSKKRLAHKWIDHLLDAENSRRLAEKTGFATPSRVAHKSLPSEMRSSSTLYPKITQSFMDREMLDANNLPDDTISQAEERAWERFLNLKK